MKAEDFAEMIVDYTDVDVYTDYSGRGMYGKKCLGVVHPPGDYSWIADLIENCDRTNEGNAGDELDAIAAAIRDMCTDSLGLDQISYFPHAFRME